MSARSLEGLHALLVQRPGRVLVLLAVVGLLSLPILLATTRFDLSFRPLFAVDPEAAAATADFEARFGQPSSAHIGVIVRREAGLTPELVSVLGRLSLELAALADVSDVLGPGRLAVPEWSDDGARSRWLLDPWALAYSVEAAESAAAALRREPDAFADFVRDEGRTFLLLVRTDVPLSDLRARTRLIRRIEGAVGAALPPDARWHPIGVSVVEAAYADAVLRSMARSLILTMLVVVVVLLLLYGRLRDVLVVLAGVAVAAPATVAALGLVGREITMLGSMVPTVVLVVGVADAIHMRRRWAVERAGGVGNAVAVRRAFVAMAVPCLLTTVTTIFGFLSLSAARVAAIRDFGIDVALGVAFVFVANQLLVPVLLRLLEDAADLESSGAGRTPASSGAGRTPARLAQLRSACERALAVAVDIVVARPGRVLVAATLAVAIGGAGVMRLGIDQRFNEELGAHTAVRAGQAALEREFGGFLGPELELRRIDGGSVFDGDARARMAALAAALAALPEVHRVHGPEALFEAAPTDAAALRAGLARLARDSVLGPRVRELVDTAGERAALHVRIGDVGTRRALELAATVEAAAQRELGDAFAARVVGQWYLAQLGMASLLDDMLASFAVSLLLVLPVLGLALRSRRVFLVAIVPNLLPALAAVAFMGWMGITLRIGTALVLAVALAIGVDDSIHVLARAREARRGGAAPADAMRVALTDTGGALVITTIVLVAGFLSMLSSDFAAIRDMGAVAAVAVLAALAADVTVLPALYLLTRRRARARTSVQPASYVIRRIGAGGGCAEIPDGGVPAGLAADQHSVTLSSTARDTA